MNKKVKWMGVAITLLLLASISSPVFAQSETEPLDGDATAVESNIWLDNPIVKLLASFFSVLLEPPVIEEPELPLPPEVGELPPAEGDSGTDGELPADVPTDGDGTTQEVPVDPALSPEEQVAALHAEDELGFGEITKLLQIASEAQAACAADGSFCEVSLDSLIAEYQSGVEMGDLFQTYGKPEITGVGQVMQEAGAVNGQGQNGELIQTREMTTAGSANREQTNNANQEKTNNGQAKGKK